MLATVALNFDANASILGTAVRWETLGIAAAVLVALLVAAFRAGRTPVPDDEERHLRRDDLLLITLGAIPGAIVGGRVGYVLLHLDYYRIHPTAAYDPGTGGSSLTLAVVLGTVGAVAVARLLGAPLGRWLHVAAVPLLLALGLGKLAAVLGGSGQGVLSDSAWSTRYTQPGPWESAFADRPAVASQLIEGGLVLAVALAILMLPVLLRFRLRRWWRLVRPGLSPRREWRLLRDGRRFVVAVALWACVRFVAASTWRDANVLGTLKTEQIVLSVLIVACLFGLACAEAVHTFQMHRSRGTSPARLPSETETRPAR